MFENINLYRTTRHAGPPIDLLALDILTVVFGNRMFFAINRIINVLDVRNFCRF